MHNPASSCKVAEAGSVCRKNLYPKSADFANHGAVMSALWDEPGGDGQAHWSCLLYWCGGAKHERSCLHLQRSLGTIGTAGYEDAIEAGGRIEQLKKSRSVMEAWAEHGGPKTKDSKDVSMRTELLMTGPGSVDAEILL